MGAALHLHIHPVLENTLMLNLSNGIDESLREMAHATCIFERSFNAINWKNPCEYSVFLEIKSGNIAGQIRFHFSYKALAGVFHGMIGGTAPPAIAEIVDVLGELSNVCYGIAKGKLNREGYSLGMSLPRAGKSTDLPSLESGRPNMIIPFNVFNETCYIQIVIL